MKRPKLPPDTRLGTVHLRVGRLNDMVTFYEEVLGFSLFAEDGATAALGTGEGRPLLVLHSSPGPVRRAQGTTGLFHVAFRVPDRADLGAMVHRIREVGKPVAGYADHNVSEALYLNDPEGNGIEVYADRTPDVWYSVDGDVFMTTEPLDVPGLLMAASGPAPRLPAGTEVGHIHLRVGSLEAAEDFYVDHLGFEVTTRSYPGALFVSAGGYHHHVGFNVWGGEGLEPPPEGSLGLVSFEVIVPSERARNRLLGDAGEGTLLDPDHISVRIAHP